MTFPDALFYACQLCLFNFLKLCVFRHSRLSEVSCFLSGLRNGLLSLLQLPLHRCVVFFIELIYEIRPGPLKITARILEACPLRAEPFTRFFLSLSHLFCLALDNASHVQLRIVRLLGPVEFSLLQHALLALTAGAPSRVLSL